MELSRRTRDVERAISGDSEALARLWERHRRWAAAVALAYMPKDAELDDLLQEIAMNVVRKIHDLRDPALFKPWLRRIAVNTARTAGRRRAIRLRGLRPAGASGALDQLPDEKEDRREAVQEGRRLLELAQRLHPDYREPLLLRCVQGLKHRQIAEALGLPVTTVETRLTRARRMLREEVEFENEASTMRIAQRTAGVGAGGDT